jgi:hypothetical protein
MKHTVQVEILRRLPDRRMGVIRFADRLHPTQGRSRTCRKEIGTTTSASMTSGIDWR